MSFISWQKHKTRRSERVSNMGRFVTVCQIVEKNNSTWVVRGSVWAFISTVVSTDTFNRTKNDKN